MEDKFVADENIELVESSFPRTVRLTGQQFRRARRKSGMHSKKYKFGLSEELRARQHEAWLK